MSAHPCHRCNGLGRIAAHSNVLGGVCFKCAGIGTQKTKPAKRKPRWRVTAVESFSGERLTAWYVRAVDAATALSMAQRQLQGTEYDASTIAVSLSAEQ